MIKKGAFSENRTKILFQKKRIWLATFIVLGYSLSLYLFFIYWREMLRYQTIDEYGDMMILSDSENYFYNFFFAGLAILTGLSYGADSLLMTQFRLRGYIKYSMTNDFSGLQWYSVYILTKLGLFYGILCWSAELNKELNLYKEYWFLFPLILIVLFCNQWIKIRLYFKNTIRQMMVAAFGFIIFAGILITIPFFDHKSFNHAVLKHTISYNYSIDLPHAETSSLLERRLLAQDLYVGYSKAEKNDSAIVIAPGTINPLTKNNLSLWLQESKKSLPEYEVDQFTISLKADKNVKIGSLRVIMDIARENNIRLLYFMTSKRDGIRVNSRPTFHEFTNDKNYLHPSFAEFLKDREQTKILTIRIVKDQFFIADSMISKTNLRGLLVDFVRANSGNYSIDIDCDDGSTYQNFILIIDQLRLSIFQLRKKFAREQFSKEYDFAKTYWEDRALDDTLSNIYPLYFYFPNEKERAYLK